MLLLLFGSSAFMIADITAIPFIPASVSSSILFIVIPPERKIGKYEKIAFPTLVLPISGTRVLSQYCSRLSKVIEGQLEVYINGNWQLLNEGEEITVSEGTPHTFRNPVNSVTTVYNIHSPAMRFDEYFEGLNTIVTSLSQGSKEKLKMNFNIATHLSMLMKKYNKEIVSVNPPNFIVSLLNAIGKMRGLKV